VTPVTGFESEYREFKRGEGLFVLFRVYKFVSKNVRRLDERSRQLKSIFRRTNWLGMKDYLQNRKRLPNT